MIIQSLLDTDLYKFTMMQVVLHHFPGAQVEYKFKCRTEGVDFRPYLDEIREEVNALTALRFRDEELTYLRSLRFMKSDFVDFPALFHFNEKYVRIAPGEHPGEMDVTIRGPWLHTIMYEIPVLAIVSEIYFRRTQPRPDLAEGRRRLKAKIDLVRTVERELDFRISDFGTRRRFSRAWHEEVLQTLKREVPEYFAGTSNVWFAMRNNLTPLGTMAHEYMQACQALGPRLRDSQTFAFDKWAQEYRGDLGIALSDTYGFDAFLRYFDMYFCKLFDGVRHDSADPFDWGERMIAHNLFGRGLGDTYVVFLRPLELEFGWTRSQLTSVYSIYLLVHGFVAPFVGFLFDRLGARVVYGAGMASLAAAFLLAGSIDSLA